MAASLNPRSTSCRLTGEVVDQGGDEGTGIIAAKKCGVNEVDAENAQGFLFAGGEWVEQVGVNNYLGGLFMGVSLEAEAKPAAAVSGFLKAAGGDGVGKSEEAFGITALGAEAFE
jgi:hypothetical protein